MSNIGKIKIYIPPSITITKLNFDLDFYTLKFAGPLGSISINLPNSINIEILNSAISLYSKDNVI
jgi:ribosomal protein L6P/L9E